MQHVSFFRVLNYLSVDRIRSDTELHKNTSTLMTTADTLSSAMFERDPMFTVVANTEHFGDITCSLIAQGHEHDLSGSERAHRSLQHQEYLEFQAQDLAQHILSQVIDTKSLLHIRPFEGEINISELEVKFCGGSTSCQ